ncbi:MAG: SNF2-related protein [Candidatus Colwellbacteria bacterium]|nr:SNF2-related protein [Candidatus Colwellbacteria bacterium]
MEVDNYKKFFPHPPGGMEVKRTVKKSVPKEIIFADSDDSEEDEKPEFIGKKRVLKEIVFESSDDDSGNETDDITVDSEKEIFEFSDPDPIFGLRLVKPYTLYTHQIEAIHWMKKIENSNPKRLNMRGGICALSPGLGKCLRPDTLVLLLNGTIKKACDVIVGDFLLGDDNTPRKVLSVTTGKDEMYRINQNKGEWYEVNSEHILSLKFSGHKGYYWSKNHFTLTWFDIKTLNLHKKNFSVMSDITRYRENTFPSKDDAFTAMMKFKSLLSPIEYNSSTRRHMQYSWIKSENKYVIHYCDNEKMRVKSFSVSDNIPLKSKEEAFESMTKFRDTISDDNIIDIEVHKYLKLNKSVREHLKGFKVGFDGWEDKDVPIDSWMIGYWLGDGTSANCGITTDDKEIVDYFTNNLGKYGLTLSKKGYINYTIKSEGKIGKGRNKFLNCLRKTNMLNNKHIPNEYLINSRRNRLALLAGLIDSDGYVNDGCCEIVQKSSKLAENIVYLCRSLGFNTQETIVQKECVNNGVWNFYHRIVFSGQGMEDIPTILPRKKFSERMQVKDALVTSIDVEHVGYGDYVGFVIDGDRRFLLGDFTVTHNTCVFASLCMTESQNPIESLQRSFPKDIANMIDGYVVSHTYPNLVICSKTVAYSWKKEISKFYGDSCPYFYMHRDSLKKNFDLLTYDTIKDYKIIITTYETVMGVANKNKVYDNQFSLDQFNRRAGIKASRKPSHQDCIKAVGGMLLFKTPWNRITADESHRFANPTSSTFYAMMALWGEKKWNLSGTPLRNYSSDLYSQFRFNGYDKIILSKQFNYSEYERGRMIDFTLYKTYEDAGIILPPITRHKIEIVLDGREKEIYDYYHSSMKQVYNGFLVGSYGFSNVLTLFLRLRQLCVVPYTILAESSRNYKGKDDEEYTLSQKILDGMTGGLASWVKDKMGSAGIESAKMKALISTLKSFKKGEKTLVFTSFKKVIDIAAIAMDEYMPDTEYLVLDGDVTGNDRDITINKFKDPSYNYSVLFISYKVGSEGLTLVEAENVIHMENWWTPVVQEQAERRVWRIGQTKPVKVYNITITTSIEERIDAICADKTKMIDDFKSSKGKGSMPKLDAATIGRMIR